MRRFDDGAMMPVGAGWRNGGAWVHHFRHGDRPLRHRMGRSRHYRRCSCRKRARSKPGGGCFSSIPTPANCARPADVEIAIDGIAALLRGGGADLSDVALDMTGIPAFNQRVYAVCPARIPRGETRTYGEVASVSARFAARCARSRRRSPATRS